MVKANNVIVLEGGKKQVVKQVIWNKGQKTYTVTHMDDTVKTYTERVDIFGLQSIERDAIVTIQYANDDERIALNHSNLTEVYKFILKSGCTGYTTSLLGMSNDRGYFKLIEANVKHCVTHVAGDNKYHYDYAMTQDGQISVEVTADNRTRIGGGTFATIEDAFKRYPKATF